ncbi:MAG: hypothetical protein L0Y80_12480 [Ignavibacteriae bacterium]|nr:hypothetical protein [Ignavibacteriota bacterium]
MVALGIAMNIGAAQERSRSSMYLEKLRATLFSDRMDVERAPHKCATPLIMSAISQSVELISSEYIAPSGKMVKALQDKSRLSPSGLFRIHYDTTGINTPALLDSFNQPIPNSFEAYVDSVAKFFDYSWSVIIGPMMYEAPPFENGDSAYNIYIEDLPVNFFGYTTPEGTIDSTALYRRYTSSITIDNDFRFTRATGMDGLRITAAHEFFHAVQYGSYGVWVEEIDPDSFRDLYFYELSAVWMEDVLFSEVNDYLEDLPDYFDGFRSTQGYSFSFIEYSLSYQGYERSIWAHFLAKRFGGDIIRRTWEAITEAPFLPSMDGVLRERQTTLADEFVTFSQWNYYTGSRADTVRFYPEGHLYPLYTPNEEITYDPSGTTSLFFRGYPLSAQYCLFRNLSDSTISVIVNVDIESAVSGSASSEPFEISFSNTTPFIPYQNLQSGIKAGFATNSPSDWRVRYLEFSTGSNASISPGPFPNPIRVNETSRVSLPVASTADEAEVFFLSSSLDLVFSATYPVLNDLGGRYIFIPVDDLRGSVHSGIYFIVVHSQDVEYRWKVAVIR